MFSRLINKLTFRLERWIQRGWLYQLSAAAVLVALIALMAGALVFTLTDDFSHFGAALWWAFLRLTDPGYLGDDEGTLLRVVSTVLTVAGSVVFLGALVAVITQWLDQKIETLESGLTPIATNNHIAILGWTNRTPDIVRELVVSKGRVQRFMKRRRVRTLRIAILAQNVNAARTQELKDYLDDEWGNQEIILRSGTSLVPDHLRRVDAARASALILPGTDYELGGAENSDARVIKSLMTLGQLETDAVPTRPGVVAEILDADKVSIARQAGDEQLNVVASDLTVARLIAQNTRHQGLSSVYEELLSHSEGNEVYLRPAGELAGRTFEAAAARFPYATLIGAVRPQNDGFRSLLNPGAAFEFAADDRPVLIAPSYEDAAPAGKAQAAPGLDDLDLTEQSARRPSSTESLRRILFLGWNHKVRSLIQEYSSYARERFQIDMLSMVPARDRQRHLAAISADDRVQLNHIEGNYTQEADLRAVEPSASDNVVFLGSDRLHSEEETDARTIMGYMLLQKVLASEPSRPHLLVELMDPDNADLLSRRDGEVIVSPKIISHMLAHVALRPELNVVFGELFGPGGAEVFFRPSSYYGIARQSLSFRTLQAMIAQRGEILLGVHAGSNGPARTHINPPDTSTWALTPDDELVVLTTY